MFPLNYPFSPLFPMVSRRNPIKRVDIGGIYELKTNALQVTNESVDFGINPSCYKALPCESIVLLKIHQGVPTAGEDLPVKIVVPHNVQQPSALLAELQVEQPRLAQLSLPW